MASRPFLQRVLGWIGPALLLVCLLIKLAEWHTDWLWFDAASYGAQFWHLMAWRAGAFAAGAALLALWLGGNAHLAWHLAARHDFPLSFFEGDTATRLIPLEDKLQLDRFRRSATVFTVALLSWLAGLGCAARYTTFLRAFHAQGVGQFDAASGYDLGFFLFQFPLWQLLSRFCLLALVCAFLLVGAIYLYEETLGLTPRAPRLVSATARHLAGLWGALLVWRGAECLLGVPGGFVGSGNVATRVFDGVDVRLGWSSALFFAISAPILALLSGMAIARHPRPRTFLIGLIWFAAAGNLPFLLPLVAGHSPQDPRWREAVTRHINSTRGAWALGDLQRQNLSLSPNARWKESSLPAIASGGAPLAIWPAQLARAAMNRALESPSKAGEAQGSLRVPQVWLERSANSLRYVGLATSLPTRSTTSPDAWPVRDARGARLSMDAVRVGAQGQALVAPPDPLSFLFGPEKWPQPSALPRAADFPDENDGEFASFDNASWVVARAPETEASETEVQGVAPAHPLTRLALAMRFLDVTLLRARPQAGEKVLWHRGAAARCAQIAPFLDWPAADVRPFVLQERTRRRLLWIVPGLVWSDDFPDSATPAANGTAPQGVNYGRQAAVGIVDGLSGQVLLFSLDENEPHLALYRRAFPGLFAPLTSLSNPIRAALRPAPTLIAAQALVWSRYHEDDPSAWASRRNDWRGLLPNAPGEVSPFRALSSQNALPGLTPSAAQNVSQSVLQSADTAAPQWLVVALGSAVGQATPGAASPLLAILGADESDFAARHGQVKWTQWQASSPLSLPDAVAQPPQTLAPGRLSLGSSALISIAPQFDAAGRLAGLVVARGEAQSAALVQAENATVAAPRLQVRWWLAGRASPLVSSVAAAPQPRNLAPPKPKFSAPRPGEAARVEPLTERLAEAQNAWRDLRSARQTGDWSAVARAEKRLDAVLAAP